MAVIKDPRQSGSTKTPCLAHAVPAVPPALLRQPLEKTLLRQAGPCFFWVCRVVGGEDPQEPAITVCVIYLRR